MYHYVRNMHETPYPEIKGLLIDKFKGQLDYLMRNYTIISLEQYADYLGGKGDIPDNSCILTFDDGLKDHYKNVFPILKERGVSGSFFVATKPLLDKSVLPVQKVQFLLATLGSEKLAEKFNSILRKDFKELAENHFIDDVKHEGRGDWYDDWDTTLTSNLKYCIASLPWEVKDKIVNEIFVENFEDERKFSEEEYLNWEEIKEMIAAGMNFGTHSHSHPDLSKLSEADQIKELEISKKIMEDNLGREINLCSYPYGIPSEKSVESLKSLGYRCVLTTEVKMNKDKVDAFDIGRYDTNQIPFEEKNVVCPICGTKNLEEVNFCENCRYPLNVKKIDEFNKEDMIVHLSSLFDCMKKSDYFEDSELEKIYDEIFSLYWLRPETAVFSFIEASLIHKFKDKYLNYPVLDLGCGDGMFFSMAFGSKINKEYDNFEIIDFSKIDPYDSYEPLQRDFLIEKGSKIGYGVDIKENSVKRAKDLGTYDDVLIGDIRKLPFEDKSISSVYSNMFDDMKVGDMGAVLKEVHRVLKDGSYLVFTTPTENFKEFLYYYNKAKITKNEEEKRKYMEYDRGRSEWDARPLDFWKTILRENSFEFVENIDYAGEDVLKFWDTGFRPFFRQTWAMKNNLRSKGLLLPIKKISVDFMKTYFHNLVKEQNVEKGSFRMIVARKV
jgi:peptidoglycan/xylan/chitin deacetylase (PgdA/CDA1 family)/SAM-dependent methyltransferase